MSGTSKVAFPSAKICRCRSLTISPRQRVQCFLRQRFAVARTNLAIDTEQRGNALHQMDVAGAEAAGGLENPLHIPGRRCPRSAHRPGIKRRKRPCNRPTAAASLDQALFRLSMSRAKLQAMSEAGRGRPRHP